MATITADTFLDDGATNRTAGEAWTINGGILTIRTDTRWHNRSPASMTGTLGATTSSATLGGGVLINATAVRWLAFDNGDVGKVVPAIDSNMTGSVAGAGVFLGVWANLTSAPTAVGAAMPVTGFIKFKSVSVAFADNEDLTVGANLLCKANGVDVAGWIEVVQREAVANTVPRLGSFKTRGAWFYLDNTLTSPTGQVLQVPTNGGGNGTHVPAVWIEGAQKAITNATWSDGVATFTCTGHGFKDKEVVMVEGITPVGYNGEREITWISADSFSMAIVADPGAFVSAGTGVVFEIYPAVLNAVFITTNFGTDARSKVVETMGNGQVRIGYNGTVALGYVPADGRRVRVPNIFGRECTSAAGDAVNLAPSATLATRPDFTTTSSGEIDFEYCMDTWYHLFASPYKVRMVNCATFDIHSTSNEASPTELNNYAIGAYNGSSISLTAVTNTLGGTIRNSKFFRVTAAADGHSASFATSVDYTITNCYFGVIAFARNTGRSTNLNQCFDFYINDCVQFNANAAIVTSFRVYVKRHDHTDRFVGSTNSTTGIYVLTTSASSDTVEVDGITFGLGGTVANVSPYLGVFYCINSSNMVFKNAGTFTSKLGCTAAAAPAYAVYDAGVNANISFKRIYLSVTRTGLHYTVNTSKNILFESIHGTVGAVQTLSLNTTSKGIRATSDSATGGTAVYGTHYFDMFTSDTLGRLWLAMNEDTATTAPYMTKSFGAGAGFTSAGQAAMQNVNDSITVETPYYIKGHTAFSSLLCPLITGTNLENFDFDYKIDLNDGAGYTANFATLVGVRLQASGGTAGQKNVVFTNPGVGTGPTIGDYAATVAGNKLTAGEVIANVVGTTITFTNNILVNMAASEAIYYWKDIVGKVIDADKGFKIKIRITAKKASTTNALTYVRMPTISSAAYQTSGLYPLVVTPATYTLTGLTVGTEVVLFNSANVELQRTVLTGTTFTYSYNWDDTTGDINAYALIWKNDKVPIKMTGIVLGNTNQSIPMTQISDLVYANPVDTRTSIVPASKLQVMAAGITSVSVSQLYSEWKNWVRLTNNTRYDFEYSILGGDTIAGSTSVPFYVFLQNSWQLRPDEANHTLNIIDGIIVATGDPFVDTLGTYTVRINYQQPVQAITVNTSGGGGATAAEVWGYATRRLSTTGITDIQTGLATDAQTQSIKRDTGLIGGLY